MNKYYIGWSELHKVFTTQLKTAALGKGFKAVNDFVEVLVREIKRGVSYSTLQSRAPPTYE